MKREYPTFETEAALCQAFIRQVPNDWIVYPETGAWDMLLVHRVGGWQIGIEAKLTLNAKVLCQATDRERWGDGPDFRAVLVGKIVSENKTLAERLGITVIQTKPLPAQTHWSGWSGAPREKQGPKLIEFMPKLPEAESLVKIGEWWSKWHNGAEWFDRFPVQRHTLPDYVPEVAAGVPSPMILSDWKIKAMRVCVWVERHGSINRAIFRALGIDPSRWMNGYWLQAGNVRGEWVAGPQFPATSLRKEHPNIYPKIEADYGIWSEKVTNAR